MDIKKYLEMFIEEAGENLQRMNQALLELEQNPDNESTLNNMFRIAHTLKGMAGTMNFKKMTKLTHTMEDVLQEVRNNELMLNPELIDILFKTFDALDIYLKNIIDTGHEGSNDYDEIINMLGTIRKGESKTVEVSNTASNKNIFDKGVENAERAPSVKFNEYEKNVIEKAFDMGMKVYYITVYLDKGCVLKSARAYLIFQLIEKHSDIIKSIPIVEDIEDEKFDDSFSVVAISKEDEELFIKGLYSISEVESVIINEIKKDNTTGIEKAKNQPSKLETEPEVVCENAVSSTKSKSVKTVRVDIEKLDILLNLVGELIIQKTRLEEIYDDKNQIYLESVQHLERIISNLHDAVMKARMVPVEMVFNRFPRMIRDISKELGKEIVLTMSGEDTELDRTIIDEIGEPLVHLLRNSIDHGIEMPYERKRLGKPEQGHIYLKAYQEGNNVIIEVEDDGHGIDLEKIKEKAVEKGIVSKSETLNMTKNEVIDILFKPSMSTSEKVGNLSGRGVGLDVVKTKIESLGGVVEIETQLGKGSRFIIRLPLTLAMIHALLVYVGGERYAIPLSNVRQIVKVNLDEIKVVQKREVILLNGIIVPLIRLDKLLNTPESSAHKKGITVVIASKGEKLYGFTVDSLIGQQEIVIKNLGKYFSAIRTISGATILGDGEVALILDINSLAF
ncbi:MAG TPA: chemotaxis protein CheA [Clostridiales bacterium]|nr:chemotaxis protein CheA [Clostridiales bacterium]